MVFWLCVIRGGFMDFVIAKEKSVEWGISLRRVQTFCEQGRINGVQRMGKIWIIPRDAKRPSDMRYTANKHGNCEENE